MALIKKDDDTDPASLPQVHVYQKHLRRIFNAQQSGLILVILLLGTILTVSAGSHVDRVTGERVNNFLNSSTLMQTAMDASFFVIMAVGAVALLPLLPVVILGVCLWAAARLIFAAPKAQRL